MKRAIFCFTIFTVLFSACNGENKKNTPPVADAGENRVISVEQLVELDGSGSSDADGDALSYEWTITQKPEGDDPIFADADSAHPIFIAKQKYDYRFQLKVFDGKEWSEPDFVKITVQAEAFEPKARIRVVPERPGIGENIYLSGASSIDPNNDPLNFYWKVVSSPYPVLFNPVLRGFSFTVISPHNSIYKLALRVDDARFTSDFAYAEITVANSTPLANAGQDDELNITVPGYYYYLNGSASDPDEDNLTYEWLVYRAPQGSNPVISNPAIRDPLFTTDMQGFYVLRFRAYDGSEWSVPDYITLCKGSACGTFLSNNTVSINPDSVELHPIFNANTGRYTANLSTSGLDIQFPQGFANTTERWVVLDCPTDTSMIVLDPNVPQSTTITFEGNINMVNSSCLLRFESDTVTYQGNITYIISSSDSQSDLRVNFVNNLPEVSGDDIVFSIDPKRVFQRIPLSISASDPDGDNLSYYWSVVTRPKNSQAFFTSDSNRPDPILYVGKEREALGEYTIRVIVEDTLGGSVQKDIKLTVKE